MTSEGISFEHGGESIPSGFHGFGSGWLVVAVPSAEARSDPGEEGQRAFWVRVFLPLGLAFEFSGEAIEGWCEGLIDHIADRARSAVPGVDELYDAQRPDQAEGRQIEQAPGVDDLAVFEGEPVALQRTEGLLDAPAQTVELDDGAGLLKAGDGVCGVQAPTESGDAWRGIDFAGFDEPEAWSLTQAFRDIGVSAVVSMQREILGSTAVECARGFYENLFSVKC